MPGMEQCDFLHNGVIACTEDACWLIEAGLGDRRLACTAHVGALLVPGKANLVVILADLQDADDTTKPGRPPKRPGSKRA